MTTLQSARDTHLGHCVDPLLDLRVGAALLGRVQRQQLGEGLAHHGLVGVWEKRNCLRGALQSTN